MTAADPDVLAAFVRARLNDDEAAARATLSINALADVENGHPIPRWTPAVTDGRLMVRDERPTSRQSLAPGTVRVGHTWESEAVHIARHDPARVLRQVAAMRAVLDQAVNLTRHDPYTEATRDALTHLAATWADHPDHPKEAR